MAAGATLKQATLAAFGLLVLLVVTRIDVLDAPFYAEDWIILEGYRTSRITDPFSLTSVNWRSPFDGLYTQWHETPLKKLNYFRPLVGWVFYPEYLLFGDRPFFYRLVSLLFFTTCFYLLLCLLFKLGYSFSLSVFPLFFLFLHPDLARLALRFTGQDLLLSLTATLWLYHYARQCPIHKRRFAVISAGIWLLSLIHEGNSFLFLAFSFFAILEAHLKISLSFFIQFFLFALVFFMFSGFPFSVRTCPPLLGSFLDVSTAQKAMASYVFLTTHTLLLLPSQITWLEPMRILVQSPSRTNVVLFFFLAMSWLFLYRKASSQAREVALFFAFLHLLFYLPAFPLAPTDSRWAPAAFLLLTSWIFLLVDALSRSHWLYGRALFLLLFLFLNFTALLSTLRQDRRFLDQYADTMRRFSSSLQQSFSLQAFERIVLVGLPEPLSMGMAQAIRFLLRQSQVQVMLLSLRQLDSPAPEIVLASARKLLIRDKPLFRQSYERMLLCGESPREIFAPSYSVTFQRENKESWQTRKVFFSPPLSAVDDAVMVVRPSGNLLLIWPPHGS